MAKSSVCGVCGMSLEGDNIFCPECGNRIIEAEAMPEESVSAPEAVDSGMSGAPAEAAPESITNAAEQRDGYINEPAAAPFSSNIPPVPPANPAGMGGYSQPMNNMPVNNGYVPPVNNMPVNNGYVPPVNNMPVNNSYVPPVNNMPVNNSYAPNVNNAPAYNGYMPPYQQYQPQMQPKPQGGAKRVMAIIGMIVGIVSIVLCCLNIIDIFIAAAGLVFSIIGIRSSKKGCAIAGIICSSIGLVSAIVFLCVGLIGIGIAEDAGVDFDSYYTEDYDSYGDMYDDMYDDIYEGIYGDMEGYYE